MEHAVTTDGLPESAKISKTNVRLDLLDESQILPQILSEQTESGAKHVA